ncbi:MAG TPA: NTP transferase domain-containing protein, partial [bacterium]|nr:NTP transferase domain-containing protein [bacterium]
MDSRFTTVIMAAGKGTRMKSDLAKVLHPLHGRPMIHYVIALARTLGSDRVIAIIGHQKERVREALADEKIEFAVQEPQLGTGHAVMQTESLLQNDHGDVLVLSGDVPVLTETTMRKLIRLHQ